MSTGSPNLVSLTLVAPMSQKFQSSCGEDCSTLFFCQWLRGPSCPASEPCQARAKGDSQEKKFKDCLLQSRGTPRGATPKKWDMPVSSSELHAELHAGQLRKNGTCLFPVPNSTRAATKKWLVSVSSSEALRKHKCHLCFPASHSCLPSPRQGEFLPAKKNVEVVVVV